MKNNFWNSHKMKAGLFAILLMLGIFGGCNYSVDAAGTEEILASGTSKDLDWELTTEGHLTVSGTGDYGVSYNKYPDWSYYADQIITAEVDASGLTRTDFMFWKCSNLTSVDLSGLDTSSATTMSDMFSGCSSLEELDLSGLDTRNVTDMSYMFKGCSSLKTLNIKGAKFSTANVTDMSLMFNGCSSLQSIDVSGFDVKKVTRMWEMFRDCTALTTLDLSNFNAPEVTDVKNMFAGCSALTSVNLIGFKADSITTVESMFSGASALTSLTFDDEFDTSNVTTMKCMFEECTSLQTISFPKFNTGNVTTMTRMFYNCNSLSSLDLTHFDTSNVIYMGSMFYSCRALTSLDLSNFNTDNVTFMWQMFYGCENLQTLNLSNFHTSNVTNMSEMFMSCDALETIQINTNTFLTDNVTDFSLMFNGCKKLESFDFTKFNTLNATKMSRMFDGCNALKVLDLRNFTMPGVDVSTSFSINMEGLEKFTSGKEERLYKLSTSAAGWVDEAGNRYADDADIELSPNTTLYRLNSTYQIKYVYDGELSKAQSSYKLDETLTLNGRVSKEHYTFDGWYTDAKFTQKITEISAGTYGDITLYAKMIPNSYTITYKNIEGITNADKLTTSYTYGKKTTPVAGTKTCFLLEGWYLDVALSQRFAGITETTGGDLILYAKWKPNHDLDKENGVIIKEATTLEEGEIRYQCKNCTYMETETIPRKVTQESQITDETILENPDDGDIKGSDFTKFQARAVKTTKNSITLKRNKIKGADGYKIYGNKCGKKNQYELIKNVKGEKKTGWTHKKRKSGTYYKYIVRAYKIVDGQEITLAVSKTIHVTTTGGKRGNAEAVIIKTDKKMKKASGGYTLTLKKNKKYTIKASEKAGARKINIHRSVRFDSTDTNVATVSGKGVVKAKNKGTCYIYAYAQNGVYKKVKVVVK